jgi:beta-glucoside operon transcriptional antiterminator
LFASLPMEHVRVSDSIITYAKNSLDKTSNQSIYITLTRPHQFWQYIGISMEWISQCNF